MLVRFTFIEELIEGCRETAAELEERANRHRKYGFDQEAHNCQSRADAFRRIERNAMKERDRLEAICSERDSVRRELVS